MKRQLFILPLFILALFSSCFIIPSNVLAPKAVRVSVDEWEAKEEKAKVAQKETAAAAASNKEASVTQQVYQQCAGMESIAAMRKVLLEHFDKNNRLKVSATQEKHPPIPHAVVQEVFADYRQMCQDKKQGEDLFVEKQYIGQKIILAVGDLHGSIYGLLDIFDDWISKGYLHDDYTLSAGVHVVFLGDYADRGQGGIEVLSMLLRLKTTNWSQVTLIRGNHENSDLNKQFGFAEELHKKYSDLCCALLSLDLFAIYETFPLVSFLSGGESFAQEKLTYAVFMHGMVDEALAKSTAAILRDMSAQKITFKNTTNLEYATEAVTWGDIAQYVSQITGEAALRSVAETLDGLSTGRPLVNAKWVEENFFDRYPSIQILVRGHQHIDDGVIFSTASWEQLQQEKALPDFTQEESIYSAGPFSAGRVSEISDTIAEHLGKVITTAAAKNIDARMPIKSLRYITLVPNTNPEMPWWDIHFSPVSDSLNPIATDTLDSAMADVTSDQPTVIASASSSSATSTSARSA